MLCMAAAAAAVDRHYQGLARIFLKARTSWDRLSRRCYLALLLCGWKSLIPLCWTWICLAHVI